MSITATTPVNLARVRQDGDQVLITYWEADFMTQFHFFKQDREIDALHTTGGTHKASIDDFISKTNGFKNLRTFIGLQSRDAHFGHHLQHALADAFLVSLHN